jgi:hypothetical protein
LQWQRTNKATIRDYTKIKIIKEIIFKGYQQMFDQAGLLVEKRVNQEKSHDRSLIYSSILTTTRFKEDNET